VGVCAQHPGDPDAIALLQQIGIDFVSCQPYAVPVARLEAGRAAVALAVAPDAR
jgi:pyruvate,orthophosphate dikinase